MPRLSPVSPKRLMKLLEREGFVCIRIKGSHHYFYNSENGLTTTVPAHSNRDVGVGLLKDILNDLHWSAEEFNKKLNR
jgi:predicted RNA binding protein YcfA (HicA-like mRNA interferase family)